MNFKIGLLALANIIGTASAIYSAGPCMNDVWQSAENSGTELSCTANEVSTTVLGIDGPSYCKRGDIIVVNVTTSIYFRASRYDFAIYTLTDNSGASDPIFGSECAIDVLGQEDNDFAPANIQNVDGDGCFDVVARNGWTLEQFKFQDNLHVPCEGEPGTTTETVHLQNCFSWRTNGQDELCDASHPAYPGSSSKCDCASMDLGIIIYEEGVPSNKPSLSPTVSTIPSSVPSLAPSTSSQPSSAPSLLPTLSSAPSSQPSASPTISTMPSSVPTLAPSTSLQPTSSPSLEPSVSAQPTDQPSASPSISTQPSAEPTSSPSLSKSPSSDPTTSPSISQEPTHQPSSSPSVSSFPSSVPSLAPSTSSAPSSEPSLSPSVSAQPTDQPSASPSVSTEPSAEPSSSPSLSTSPSASPSDAPSISQQPTDQPSASPSTSTEPSSEPTLNPSLSSSPSADPTSAPSLSSAPSSEPSASPSISTQPSSEPSDAPSISQAPTDQPSASPSISTQPSSEPTLNPSLSSSPSADPTIAPSLSSAPSSEPSASPSISTQPTSEPSDAPSISQAPTNQPSASPSISTEPSSEPTLNPSLSSSPSANPTSAPSLSSAPTDQPSASPSISTQPTSEPSSNPSLSSSPSANPSSTPSISAAPTAQPSAVPSISSQPSTEPTSKPSLSTKPTLASSSSPSVSAAPSSEPSLNPTLSSKPSSEPSSTPSVSSQPSLEPSTSPSVSAAPSAEPSLNPTLSSKPSSEPSSVPSVSTQPSSNPSTSPSISAEPSSEPTLLPSVSTSPSSHPTLTPSAPPSSNPTSVAGVGGTVWDDLNGDGLIDSGEVMLPNVEVSLLDEEGNVVDTTTSASDGSYFFSGVVPDTYSIKVVSGVEYIFSPVVSGGNQMRSVESGDNQIIQTGSGQGTSNPIALSGGEERDDIHAGMFKPITIGNKVWNDLNGNGLQEIDELGISDVEVSLIDDNGAVVETTETDSDGYYRFTGLSPGIYSVKFNLPSGYSFTQSAEILGDIQLDGLPLASADGSFLYADVTSDANVNTGITEQVEVTSGDINLSLDAGIYIPAKIVGFVWHDLNANGIQEEGEEGIEGAVITLFNDASASPGSAVSDSTGKYLFDGLRPGRYYGFFEVPSEEYFMSPTGQGSPDTDSDFDPDTMSNSFITLLSGDENLSQFDAGLYQLASVGDFVWLDSAADGIQAADEIGFPFPVTINLYSMNNELQMTTTSNETGAYLFEDLMPGEYEIEFIMEEGDILSPPFRGNDEELDSNVDPTTKRAQVTLVSGEDNFSVDAGIIANAPYYPDWVFDVQVCTNDGFDPEWMTTNNEGEQIYLYRNKEECCENHFWWRMAQCMANEEYKFYRNGEICDSKIKFEDWEMNSPAEWTDTKLFDTLDECCANLFSYDYSGCIGRSPVAFKFDFCFDVGALLPPIDCQTADIHANVLEDAINLGLGEGSDANITRVGDASLIKVDGSTQCGGSLEGQDFINDLTGTIGEPDLTDLPDSTTVCGVITTESYDCTSDDCLNDIYHTIIGNLGVYLDDGSLTANLNSLATTRLPPVQELQVADGIAGSLNTYNLLLPSTISSQLGDLKYFKDTDSCSQKTAFASWETKYDTLLDCCTANFNWQLEVCCAEGGGCGSNDPSTTSATTTTTDSTTTTSATTTENPITSTTSTIPVTTTENPATTTTSSTVQTTTENPATTTTTSTVQTTTENPVSSTTSTVQTTTETPATTTTSSTIQTTTVVTTTSPPVFRFYADQSVGAEKLCNLKPLSEFESWEAPYEELKDCCTDKFSWDYAKCCSGEGLGGCGDPPPTVKYYPTWQDGKLCQSKTSFDEWEQSYDTLSDCCTSSFAYAYDACCQSDGMGGCV